MLTIALKDLEEKGLIIRKQFNEIPPHVEYSLSEAGQNLYPVFMAMAEWGGRKISIIFPHTKVGIEDYLFLYP